jgi:hypothetical protein
MKVALHQNLDLGRTSASPSWCEVYCPSKEAMQENADKGGYSAAGAKDKGEDKGGLLTYNESTYSGFNRWWCGSDFTWCEGECEHCNSNKEGDKEKANKSDYSTEAAKDKREDKGEGDKEAVSFMPPTSRIGASLTIMQSM